jgi:hypothetical protein
LEALVITGNTSTWAAYLHALFTTFDATTLTDAHAVSYLKDVACLPAAFVVELETGLTGLWTTTSPSMAIAPA